MSRHTRARLSFAVVGLVFTILGAYIWRRGGITLPGTYQGFAVPLPLHFAFLALGLLLIAFPQVVVSTLIFLLPERARSPLPPLLDLLTTDPEPDQLPDNATATQVAAHVEHTYKRHMRRLYGTVSVSAAVLFVVLPFAITEQLSRTEFQRSSDRLVEVIQQFPLDYSSADHVRAVLRDTEASVHSFPGTATAKLHEVLSDLYAAPIASPKDFDIALVAAYKNHVCSRTGNGASTIAPSVQAMSSNPTHEGAKITAAYLTTLAIICDEQGNQGEFLPPYLFARKLLAAASDIAKDKPLAITSNMQGVTYSALLRRYDEYAALPKNSNSGIGADDAPVSCVTLARSADDAFSAAVDSNTNNFNRSRHLNNRADLRMWLIHYAHILKRPLVSQDEGERQFLRAEIDPPPAGALTWRPSELPHILQRLRKELDSAFSLSPDARILVTRSQLLSLTGQVCESYKLETPPCNNPSLLLTDAINDVTMARRMGLSFRFFNERRADELFMSWMWQHPEGQAALSAP